MAQTAFTKTSLPITNAVTGAAITWAACDSTNGNSITASGSEVCVVVNVDSSAHTFTITGQADPQGRTTNFAMSVPGSASFSAAALSAIITPRLSSALWSNTGIGGGLILLPSSNNANLVVGVLTGV